MEYNRVNNIKPETIIKPVPEKEVDIKDIRHIPKQDIPNLIVELEAQMNVAAENLEFEEAIRIRDRLRSLKERQAKSS